MPDDLQSLSTGPQGQPERSMPQDMTGGQQRETNARFDVAGVTRQAVEMAAPSLLAPIAVTVVTGGLSLLMDVATGPVGLALSIPVAAWLFYYWRKVMRRTAPAAPAHPQDAQTQIQPPPQQWTLPQSAAPSFTGEAIGTGVRETMPTLARDARQEPPAEPPARAFKRKV
jgi:hypothetical protein